MVGLVGVWVAQRLKELHLQSNMITVVGGLEKLRDLAVLMLQRNSIVEVGAGLKNQSKLKTLRLDQNKLVPPLSGIPPNVETLGLSCNSLSSLEGIGTLRMLTELYAADNLLMAAPTLAKGVALTELDLSRNKLVDLSSLAAAKKLVILRINDNFLPDLKSLPVMAALQEIHVASNRLVTLESLAEKAPKLTVLDASKNRITAIKALPLASNLTELMVAGNKLVSSDAGIDLVETKRALLELYPNLDELDGSSVIRKGDGAEEFSAEALRPCTAWAGANRPGTASSTGRGSRPETSRSGGRPGTASSGGRPGTAPSISMGGDAVLRPLMKPMTAEKLAEVSSEARLNALFANGAAAAEADLTASFSRLTSSMADLAGGDGAASGGAGAAKELQLPRPSTSSSSNGRSRLQQAREFASSSASLCGAAPEPASAP